MGSRSRSSEKGKREMDISEEQRAAHKREFLEFLDQDVRTHFSLSLSFNFIYLCVINYDLMVNL